MRKPVEPACNICKFYQVNAKAVDRGICRRYPPTAHTLVVPGPMGPQPQQQFFHPQTHGRAWCGEYQLKVEGIQTSEN